MQLKTYIVENSESGSVFGVYEGRDADAAIRAMLATAGETEAPGEGLAAIALDSVSGERAIRYTKAIRSLCPGEDVVTLVKVADPTEGERVGLSYDEAEDIIREDPSLVRLAWRREHH